MQNNKNNIDCSVIILAAGQSRRMGYPKFTIPFNKKDSFLDVIIDQYHSFGCKNIITVLNNEGINYIEKQGHSYPNNVSFVTNLHLEYGRFYSIKLGLKKLPNTHPVFIHNVDNPFVNHDTLQKLISNLSFDYVTPSFKGRGGHPILISDRITQQIISQDENNLILSEFLKRFKKHRIEVDDRNILVNINTPEEYQLLKKQIN